MVFYLYGEIFGFFKQQTLTDITSGKAGFIGTQSGLFAAAVSVAIPSMIIVLSLALAPTFDRFLNIILGATYTIIIILGMPGSWAYYEFLGGVEAALTLLIVWYAWRWPKEPSS